jgi:hypothetical protein
MPSHSQQLSPLRSTQSSVLVHFVNAGSSLMSKARQRPSSQRAMRSQLIVAAQGGHGCGLTPQTSFANTSRLLELMAATRSISR